MMRRALFFALACVLSAAHAQTGTYTAPQAPAVVQPVPPEARANPPPEAALAPRAAAAPTDFQEFIFRSTGERLPLYGYDLFRAAPSTFAPLENVPVTPEYLVGPRDELMIRAWGQLDIDYRETVDRN